MPLSRHILLGAIALAALLALGYAERQGRDATAGIVAERDAQVMAAMQRKRGPDIVAGTAASSASDCPKLRNGKWLRFQVRHDYEPDARGRRLYTIQCEYGPLRKAVTEEWRGM